MFGFCYKIKKDKSKVTVYTDNIRAIMLMAVFFTLPFGLFFIYSLSLEVRQFLFVFSILCIALMFGGANLYRYLRKIPLFSISEEGIKPILTRKGLNLNAKVIRWDTIDKVFVYQPVSPYNIKETQKLDEPGFRYLGITLIFPDESNLNKVHHPMVVPTLQTLPPYSHDIDISLTMAHPFQKGLVKWLSYYCQQYSEQKSEKKIN